MRLGALGSGWAAWWRKYLGRGEHVLWTQDQPLPVEFEQAFAYMDKAFHHFAIGFDKLLDKEKEKSK